MEREKRLERLPVFGEAPFESALTQEVGNVFHRRVHQSSTRISAATNDDKPRQNATADDYSFCRSSIKLFVRGTAFQPGAKSIGAETPELFSIPSQQIDLTHGWAHYGPS
jgi:hypothetical protein